MSLHKPESELSRLNATAVDHPVEASPALYFVIAKAVEISNQTDGAFDPTIRPLADLWGFIWKEYRFPTVAERERVLPKVNFRLLKLDSTRRTIRYLREGVSIDLGGIAKGYAVDCAIEKLRTLGVERAMVKAGGDLRVIGLPPQEKFWEVQLEDPEKKGRRVAVRLEQGALSTSGNYENFFMIEGVRYGHILNPRTGLPVQGIAACTVTAATCIESDAWATALYVHGVEPSLQKFGNSFGIRFVLLPTAEHPTKWPVRQSRLFPPVLQ